MLAYDLHYRPDLHLLLLRWQHDTPLAETQAGYADLLARAQQHGCARWLLDVRRRGPADAPTSAWLVTDLLPAAVAQVAPLPLRVAVFNSPLRHQQLATDAALAPHIAHAIAPERPYQLRNFADEGLAVAWLTAAE